MGNQYAKNHGLDKLPSQLEEAQKACNAIDGELGSVHFNPEKPESIEAAIVSREELIDERLGPCSQNPIVAPMIEEMKAKYRGCVMGPE